MKFLSALVLVLALGMASDAFALSLKWDPVLTDATGAPLSPGNTVTSYNVYKCNTPAASCTKATATLLSSVVAPATTFTLVAQPIPSSFFVTAVNVTSESPESFTVKIVPPDFPKNVTAQNP